MDEMKFITREEHLAAYKAAAQETANKLNGLDAKFARYVEQAYQSNQEVAIAIQQIQLNAQRVDGDIKRQNTEINNFKTLISEVKDSIHGVEKGLLNQKVWFLLTGMSFVFGAIGVVNILVK